MIYKEKQILNANQMNALRKSSQITPDEYAYIAGDLLVAENIKTSEKRVLGQASEVLTESNKRVLKG
tara:strand:+ start:4591 stop:4791 length:201 start_codon:yes stop_codon:yes gene_type:complete